MIAGVLASRRRVNCSIDHNLVLSLSIAMKVHVNYIYGHRARAPRTRNAYCVSLIQTGMGHVSVSWPER